MASNALTVAILVFSWLLQPAQASENELPVISISTESLTVMEGQEVLIEVASDKPLTDELIIRLVAYGDAFEILGYLPTDLFVRLTPEQATANTKFLLMDDETKFRDSNLIVEIANFEPSKLFKLSPENSKIEISLIDND